MPNSALEWERSGRAAICADAKKKGPTAKGYGPEEVTTCGLYPMRVQQLADSVGVSPHVVRYYTRVGLLRPKRDAANGYRSFSADDVKRLVFIRQAQRLGFKLAEVRHILEMSGRGKTPCPTVRVIVQERIAENSEYLTELQALQERMTKALHRWRRMRDGVPDGNAICRLIEAVSEKLT